MRFGKHKHVRGSASHGTSPGMKVKRRESSTLRAELWGPQTFKRQAEERAQNPERLGGEGNSGKKEIYPRRRKSYGTLCPPPPPPWKPASDVYSERVCSLPQRTLEFWADVRR